MTVRQLLVQPQAGDSLEMHVEHQATDGPGDIGGEKFLGGSIGANPVAGDAEQPGECPAYIPVCIEDGDVADERRARAAGGNGTDFAAKPHHRSYVPVGSQTN